VLRRKGGGRGQGTAMDMLEDVNCGISWTIRKIMYYGGDPDQIWLVGQSCGAHLAMMALITQVGGGTFS
jgi:prenylcysteine alpha-carboxyl methylesterase